MNNDISTLESSCKTYNGCGSKTYIWVLVIIVAVIFIIGIILAVIFSVAGTQNDETQSKSILKVKTDSITEKSYPVFNGSTTVNGANYTFENVAVQQILKTIDNFFNVQPTEINNNVIGRNLNLRGNLNVFNQFNEVETVALQVRNNVSNNIETTNIELNGQTLVGQSLTVNRNLTVENGTDLFGTFRVSPYPRNLSGSYAIQVDNLNDTNTLALVNLNANVNVSNGVDISSGGLTVGGGNVDIANNINVQGLSDLQRTNVRSTLTVEGSGEFRNQVTVFSTNTTDLIVGNNVSKTTNKLQVRGNTLIEGNLRVNGIINDGLPLNYELNNLIVNNTLTALNLVQIGSGANRITAQTGNIILPEAPQYTAVEPGILRANIGVFNQVIASQFSDGSQTEFSKEYGTVLYSYSPVNNNISPIKETGNPAPGPNTFYGFYCIFKDARPNLRTNNFNTRNYQVPTVTTEAIETLNNVVFRTYYGTECTGVVGGSWANNLVYINNNNTLVIDTNTNRPAGVDSVLIETYDYNIETDRLTPLNNNNNYGRVGSGYYNQYSDNLNLQNIGGSETFRIYFKNTYVRTPLINAYLVYTDSAKSNVTQMNGGMAITDINLRDNYFEFRVNTFGTYKLNKYRVDYTVSGIVESQASFNQVAEGTAGTAGTAGLNVVNNMNVSKKSKKLKTKDKSRKKNN